MLQRAAESLRREVFSGVDGVQAQKRKLEAWEKGNGTVLTANAPVAQFNAAIDAFQRIVQRVRDADPEGDPVKLKASEADWNLLANVFRLEYAERQPVGGDEPRTVKQPFGRMLRLVIKAYEDLKQAIEKEASQRNAAIEAWQVSHEGLLATGWVDYASLAPVVERLAQINNGQNLASLLNEGTDEQQKKVLDELEEEPLAKYVDALSALARSTSLTK